MILILREFPDEERVHKIENLNTDTLQSTCECFIQIILCAGGVSCCEGFLEIVNDNECVDNQKHQASKNRDSQQKFQYLFLEKIEEF